MKSFISHLILLRIFLGTDSSKVFLYRLRIFFKYSAHLYTQTLRFNIRDFIVSSHMKKIQQTCYSNRFFTSLSVLIPQNLRGY